MVSIVVDGDFIRRLAGKVGSMNKLERCRRDLVNDAFDFQADAMSCFKEISCGHDLDFELVNFSGDEGFGIGMRMERLPGF